MTDGWERNPIMFRVSAEMMEDLTAFHDLQAAINEEFWHGLSEMDRQNELDDQYGMNSRHRPSRAEYNDIMEPVWRRAHKVAAIRRNVHGRPAGTFTRPENNK